VLSRPGSDAEAYLTSGPALINSVQDFLGQLTASVIALSVAGSLLPLLVPILEQNRKSCDEPYGGE